MFSYCSWLFLQFLLFFHHLLLEIFIHPLFIWFLVLVLFFIIHCFYTFLIYGFFFKTFEKFTEYQNG